MSATKHKARERPVRDALEQLLLRRRVAWRDLDPDDICRVLYALLAMRAASAHHDPAVARGILRARAALRHRGLLTDMEDPPAPSPLFPSPSHSA